MSYVVSLINGSHGTALGTPRRAMSRVRAVKRVLVLKGLERCLVQYTQEEKGSLKMDRKWRSPGRIGVSETVT